MNIKKTLVLFFIIFILVSAINIVYLPSTRPSIHSEPPVIEVNGNHYRMGLQHGRQAKEQIKTYARLYNIFTSIPGLNPSDILQKFESDIEKYAPNLVSEMKGIAKGADVSYEFILFLNVFLSMRCTAWGATGSDSSDGLAVLGKNRDFTYAAYKNQIILKASPENGNSFVALTNAGLVGMDQFLNEKGLGVVYTMVSTKDQDSGISTMLASRLMAERYTDAENVVNLLDNVVISHGGNFLLADDSNQILCIEVAGG